MFCRVGRVFEAHHSSVCVVFVGLEDSTHPTKQGILTLEPIAWLKQLESSIKP
jgi:hypothetical protein